MKQWYLITWIFCALFSLLSCRTDQKSDESAQSTTDTDVQIGKDSAETISPPALPFIAEYNEVTDQFEINPNPDLKHAESLEAIQAALHRKYPDIPLAIDHVSHDTLHVKIDDAMYLTQSMGTSGATAFLAEATYGFTEIENINVVDFEFKEGDHAVPGPYTRTSFGEFLK